MTPSPEMSLAEMKARLAQLVSWHGDVPIPEIGGLRAAIREREAQLKEKSDDNR